MRKSILLLGAAVGLAACGRMGESANEAATNAAANAAAAKPKTAYCFFKDQNTKAWKVRTDSGGNVVVTGKALAEDARYKAVMGPPSIVGTNADIAPTITTNDTGFAAPGNWWNVSEMIPNSQTLTSVTVKCGDETLATLSVPRKK